MRQITAILIGAGNRGAEAYAHYALQYPHELKIVGVAEPRKDRRDQFARLHGIEEKNCFADWAELLSKDKFADCAMICTPDHLHFAPVLTALERGYDVLCEKPMSGDREEILAMAHKAKECGRLLSVCHVLRYSPFFSKIKTLLDDGVIGDLMCIQHIESIGFWHMAHSFVRGNWRSGKGSNPIILAKCCHDMDILSWLVGAHCTSVSSYGSLSHFRPENKPEGAPNRCLDGCQHRDQCPYYAPRFYLEHPQAKKDGFDKIISLDTTSEGLLSALQTGPYGRCVYACDNDVADHQVVNLQYENGVTVSMTMSAFTEKCERIINIMGSKGQIIGNMDDNSICYSDFATGEKHSIELRVPAGNHNGSDVSMMRNFVQLIASGSSQSLTDARTSVESHLIALAAEESRLQGGKPITIMHEAVTK